MPASPTIDVKLDMRPLHDLTHSAVQAQREDDGWWSDPLETAIVAVADARHAPGAKRMAEPALESLTRWLDSDEPRAIGSDAAAAALAARAARALHGGNRNMTSRAIELIERVCRGNALTIAPLHVALATWALADLTPDSRDAPWDDVRSALTRFSDIGVNGALVAFARVLADEAAPRMDTRIADVMPESRLEECLLLWLLSAAIEVDLKRGADADQLRPLLTRRAALLDQLTAELTPLHLTPNEFDDFNPFDDPDEVADDALGLFEATLLDLALSGERPKQALVTLDEAQRLHAGDASGRRRTYAAVAMGATFVLAAMTGVICVLASSPARLTVGVVLSLLTAGCAASLWVFLHKADTRWPADSLIVGLLLETILGLFLVIEGALGNVIVSDEVAALLGLGGLGLPLTLQALVNRFEKK